MKKRVFGGYLLLILFLLYAPILILTLYSFTDSATIGAIHGFSIHNYQVLFSREELRTMIFGTLLLALVTAAISSVLGTLGAVGAFYSKKKTRFFMEIMNKIPVVNADVVTGFSICVLLIVFFRMDKDTCIPMLIGLTSLCTPFVYLSVMPRLQQLDSQIYEAALDLGCTPFRAIRKVILPQLVPGITSGFMLSVTLVLDDYFITTYTKPATFDTISTYVVNATKGAQTEVKTALWALSAVIFACVLLFVLVKGILAKRAAAQKEKQR